MNRRDFLTGLAAAMTASLPLEMTPRVARNLVLKSFSYVDAPFGTIQGLFSLLTDLYEQLEAYGPVNETEVQLLTVGVQRIIDDWRPAGVKIEFEGDDSVAVLKKNSWEVETFIPGRIGVVLIKEGL